MSSAAKGGSNSSDEDKGDAKPPGLSLTQIVAGAATAVTTTYAMSFLGVVGTILGAAVASMVSVLGNHLYTRSLQRTQAQVAAARLSRMEARRRAREAMTIALPLPHVHTSERQTADEEFAAAEDAFQDADPERRQRLRRRLLVSIASVFAVILLVITALELAVGQRISDFVRGDPGTGTSVFGGAQQAPTTSARTTDTAPTSATTTVTTPTPTPTTTTAVTSTTTTATPTDTLTSSPITQPTTLPTTG